MDINLSKLVATHSNISLPDLFDQSQTKEPFSICGDDLIGIWTPRFAKRYETVVEQLGGKFSVGKHYKSFQYGVFTEEIFQVEEKAVTIREKVPIPVGTRINHTVIKPRNGPIIPEAERVTRSNYPKIGEPAIPEEVMERFRWVKR